jgi:hypothetical protein
MTTAEFENKKERKSSGFSSFPPFQEMIKGLKEKLQNGIRATEPVRIEEVSARAMDGGDLVVVQYRASSPLLNEGRRVAPYLIDMASGKRLNVQRIPYFGALASHAVGHSASREGYFVVDNRELILQTGSSVKVVVGDLEKENVIVDG